MSDANHNINRVQQKEQQTIPGEAANEGNNNEKLPRSAIAAVYDKEKDLGKVFSKDPDTGEICKKAAGMPRNGLICNFRIKDEDQMADLVMQATESQRLCLIMGTVKDAGFEEKIHLVTQGAIDKHAKRIGKAREGIYDANGKKYVARAKENYDPVPWLLIDADNPEGMPKEQAAWTIQQRLEYLDPIIPGISKCLRIEWRSGSARVKRTGEPSKNKTHAFLRISDPEKIEMLRAHFRVRIVDGFSFDFGKKDSATGVVVGVEARTVIDLAPWQVGHPLFTAPPQLSQGLIDDGWKVDDAGVEIVNPKGGVLNVLGLEMPDPQQLRDYSKKTRSMTVISKDGTAITSTVEGKLTLDTEIEVRGARKPLREWVNQIDPVHGLRCQTPFRPDSRSEAGWLYKTNGKIGLYDHIGIKYPLHTPHSSSTTKYSSIPMKTTAAGLRKAPFDKLETDSEKSIALAKATKNQLAWDDIEQQWLRYLNGRWQVIGNDELTKVLAEYLDNEMPKGYAITLLNNMVKFLKIRLGNTEWNRDRHLLPLSNGMLDMNTMKLVPNAPSQRFRWRLPFDYDSKADCPTIKQWLRESVGDDDVVQVLRAVLYFTLLYDPEVQKMLELLGPGGTGKSTFVRLMQQFIGTENHVTTDLKNLETNRFEAAVLYGKRAVTINDSSRYGGGVSVLKAITGGDPLRYEKKHIQQGGGFIAECFITIVSNEPIQSTDYTSGLSRRRVPVIFSRQVTDADKAKWASQGGIEKVMQSELPGLLNWVLAMGRVKAFEALSDSNSALNKSRLKHLVDTNPLAAWAEDRCVLMPGAITYTGRAPTKTDTWEAVEERVASKLYPNYRNWCEENCHKPMAVRCFGDRLDDLFTNILKLPVSRLEKDRIGRPFEGIAIRDSKRATLPTPILGITFHAQSRDAKGTML